jgi:hypothetical protein
MLRTTRVAEPEVLAHHSEKICPTRNTVLLPVAQSPGVSLHRVNQLKTKAHSSDPHVRTRGPEEVRERLGFLAWVGAGINPEKFFQS